MYLSMTDKIQYSKQVKNIRGVQFSILFIILFTFIGCQNNDLIVDAPINSNPEENTYLEAYQQNFDTLKLQALVIKINNGRKYTQ